MHVDRGASNKECSSRQPEKAGWTRGRRTTDRNTCTGPYMGTHCERNRVPHERYILPSQPTAPFRDVAFHIAAVSPLLPIADRYRLTYARAIASVSLTSRGLRLSAPSFRSDNLADLFSPDRTTFQPLSSSDSTFLLFFPYISAPPKSIDRRNWGIHLQARNTFATLAIPRSKSISGWREFSKSLRTGNHRSRRPNLL